MKDFKGIQEYKDIDTYYEILNLVGEIFEDRVEAHKHLINANKEIERLNNIINELEKWLKEIPDISYSNIHTLNKLNELKENK